ncbi:MAG: enoyl-CoA hydratase/isomerase family protein [Hydrogenophilaceae bacterium]|jgi:enoyl-CoA hydratase|nr:enoyl-CoA hydratase/isomerase family protein [Hydrogenophilaceae bacterium]
MSQPLLVERKGPVAHVTLNRPESLNALNRELTDALTACFEGFYRDYDIRVVVLKGAGRAFCAGLDLKGYDAAPRDQRSVQHGFDTQTRIRDIYKAMRRCPQPIVALVHGAACGGGFSLALASDIRIAGESARMNAAYIRIGLTGCDMGSSYFLPRLVGQTMASELLLTGRFVEAREAKEIGLVNRVVPDAQMEEAAAPLIEAMLANTPMGLRLTKDAINFSIDAPSMDAAMAMEDRQQVLTAQTHDHREALSAFLEKRPPNYADK